MNHRRIIRWAALVIAMGVLGLATPRRSEARDICNSCVLGLSCNDASTYCEDHCGSGLAECYETGIWWCNPGFTAVTCGMT